MKWTVLCADFLGWPILQLSVSALAYQLPKSWFPPPESQGTLVRLEILLYRRWCMVRSWKGLLPDGGVWAAEFRKGKIARRDFEYLWEYAAEARRGELAHWAMLACTPIFFLWNPLWACLVMVVYGLASNLPCIMAQRYNRAFIMMLIIRHRPRVTSSLF